MLTSTVYELLDDTGRHALAGVLGDRPDTAMVVYALTRGACRAYARGKPDRPLAAVVEIAGLPGEPVAYGADMQEMWTLLAGLDGWRCVLVGVEDAPVLGARIEEASGGPVRYYRDIGLVLTRPAARFPHPAVRRLTKADVRLLEDAPHELMAAGYATPAALLADGYVAGAIVEGQKPGALSLVATAQAHGLVGRYAEVGVHTLPAWRRQGLGVAVASLVAQCVQDDGCVPVWSAGHDNAGSLRIAEMVGFEQAFHRCYVIKVLPEL